MGEDNIVINGYTIYYNGQPLGYVNGLGLAEERSTCFIDVECVEDLSIQYLKWRLNYIKTRYKNYKKKKRIKKQ